MPGIELTLENQQKIVAWFERRLCEINNSKIWHIEDDIAIECLTICEIMVTNHLTYERAFLKQLATERDESQAVKDGQNV